MASGNKGFTQKCESIVHREQCVGRKGNKYAGRNAWQSDSCSAWTPNNTNVRKKPAKKNKHLQLSWYNNSFGDDGFHRVVGERYLKQPWQQPVVSCTEEHMANYYVCFVLTSSVMSSIVSYWNSVSVTPTFSSIDLNNIFFTIQQTSYICTPTDPDAPKRFKFGSAMLADTQEVRWPSVATASALHV